MERVNFRKTIRRWLGAENQSAPDEGFAPAVVTVSDGMTDWSAQRLIRESQRAWRDNPIARRIVSITSQYVIGKGFRFSCDQPETQDFLMSFWNHPFNRMETRIREWCEELCRSGNLFILFSTDLSGMSFVRAIPADSIIEIRSCGNDAEQPLAFRVRSSADGTGTFPAAMAESTFPAAVFDRADPEPAILHFSVNTLIGSQWGEPDLGPLLRWIGRYSNWLEDRARLNRYRNSFLFVVKSRMIGEAQRLQRQRQLNAIPPEPGSILVTNENESWEVLSPRLESADANQDGLALKKMIAAGAGIPLHFLAEPESENKASAESAGESTYRHFEQRQQYMIHVVRTVLKQVLIRGAAVRSMVDPDVEVRIQGDDISAADNLSNARAAFYMVQSLEKLSAAGILSHQECRRIAERIFSDEPLA